MSAAQPQPEALRLAEAMKQRVIPRWVHATGETPRQSGFAADAECQAAAAELLRLHAECEALRASLRSERARADHIAEMLGDAMNQHILAMRAAVVDSHLRCAERGMQWIVNTLSGPGLLPDVDEAIELGGAQALFDKEMAEHDALRKTRRTIDAARAAKEQSK